MIPTIAVLSIVILTLTLGTVGLRFARTTSNFFVASRSVNPVWNAFAVCGEAMSAASYLGVPALILVFGVDMLWALVGWTVGFLLLSLFIAAPVRRFGSYTIPEFVEGRLDAPRLRPMVAVLVIVVSWFFLLGQLKGAGVVVRALTGMPYWAGVVAVCLLVAINLNAGGMRGITFVQGFQFFFIFLGVLVPFAVLSVFWARGDQPSITAAEPPTFATEQLAVYPRAVDLVVPENTEVDIRRGSLTATADVPSQEPIDESDSSAGVLLPAGTYRVAADTEILWPAGALAPHREGIEPLTGDVWAAPLGDKGLASGHPLYFSFATFLANMFGIMGLPHIVVRFYTNPTGREARRTSVWVLAIIAPYYAMLPLFGALGRVAGLDLLGSGATDSTTVVVGERLVNGIGGELLTSVVAAGAAAAFLSTSSGLLIAMAGAMSHDILSAGVPQFRFSVWVGAMLSIGAGLLVESIDINLLVGWSASIAASSICPLLVLGIWWPGLTRRGALAAAGVGGSVTTLAALTTMFGLVESGWPRALLATPAAWSVPVAFAVGIAVSIADDDKVEDLGYKFALMHLPERVEEMVRPAKAPGSLR